MKALTRFIAFGAALGVAAVATLGAAQESAQKLLERGAYAEAAQRVNSEREAGNNDPASTYLAGQAFLKLDQNQQAREEFARLSNGGDETWRAIGQSSIALIDQAMDEAVNEAQKARDMNGDLGFTHYQLGLVLNRRNDFDAAAQSLDRAAQLMPDFAYAYYHAGVAHQRARRFNEMAERFQTFLRLAPDAPEKRMVQLALNALRG
jgi:tetratricopeptide (TPR) repeat protein